MKKIYNYVLVGFLAVLLFYALFITFTNIKKNMPVHAESFDQLPKIKIALFKATWCGHCNKYAQTSAYTDLFVNGKDKYESIVFEIYDADADSQLASKYNINGYPSIIAIDAKSGTMLATFEGNREDKDAIVQFAKDTISKKLS